MLRVALTGGIATGKSYVLGRLRAAGIPTVDADALVHEALAAGSPAIPAIQARFGGGVLAANGSIDRKALGHLVFADAAARADLEAILHPEVYRRIDEWFGELVRSPEVRRSGSPNIDDRTSDDKRGPKVPRSEGPKVNGPVARSDSARRDVARFAVADIPLLFETHHEAFFDRVIVTACPPALQIARLEQRNRLTAEEARQRLAAQLPIDEKVRRADYVIDTSGTFEETDRQVDRVIAALGASPPPTQRPDWPSH